MFILLAIATTLLQWWCYLFPLADGALSLWYSLRPGASPLFRSTACHEAHHIDTRRLPRSHHVAAA